MSAARAEENETAAEPEADQPPAYSVTIEGVSDGNLRSLLERSSQLVALKNQPPISQGALVRRIQGDFDRFQAVMRSQGYYDAEIDYRIDDNANPQAIAIIVSQGPTYTLKSYTIAFVGDNQNGVGEQPPLSALGLTIGQRAESAPVLAAERRLFADLANESRPLATLVDRDAVIDHSDQSLTVAVKVDPGPFTRFGPLTFEGLTTVQEQYVRRLVPWQEGEPYDQRKVDELRKRLIETGLFSAVVFDRPDTLDADGTLPMTISLIEGKQRSIGAGAKYYTSEGPAGEVFWEHRNLFGNNEDLRITLEVGQIKQEASVDFVKPDYKLYKQDLLARFAAIRQDTDAFHELGVETSAKIRRPLTETWSGLLGTSLEWSQLDDNNGTRSSTLAGLPAALIRDSTDDALDPHQGMRLQFDATPYVGWFDETVGFMVAEAGASRYVSLDDDKRYVLAGRAKVGSILGESRADIPANKRFYAGGGDSIRGYQYQKVGPLDSSNDPIGGRSLAEVGAELRARVWGNFGIAPFIDGGGVYTSLFPEVEEDFRWAGGIGLRYYTVLGPLRFDVAFPINPRKDVDDPYQFYISIGQAF